MKFEDVKFKGVDLEGVRFVDVKSLNVKIRRLKEFQKVAKTKVLEFAKYLSKCFIIQGCNIFQGYIRLDFFFLGYKCSTL